MTTDLNTMTKPTEAQSATGRPWEQGRGRRSPKLIVSVFEGTTTAYFKPTVIARCETEADAAFIVRVANAHNDMLAALKALDASWTADFPDGPYSDLGPIVSLSDDTIAIWKQIRSAINQAA